jgi:hypothetical protein
MIPSISTHSYRKRNLRTVLASDDTVCSLRGIKQIFVCSKDYYCSGHQRVKVHLGGWCEVNVNGQSVTDGEIIVQRVISFGVKSNQIIKHHSFNTNKQYGISVSLLVSCFLFYSSIL